ncbi:sulfotransferase domain-containing protein [Rufibacter glacialis]|uniref:Sulfotransferase n=1 Tax=Rufibacter glacialis TaxID=1259555 RepID=A0A5M8Q5Z5_9BACT|nr:sulfotransferase domain-containing protein [Rufibacter glacialis]KAA6430753.1 sulfotransferase [Rufibacter glacialis]GGK86466.1 hypothetical protein GCM10011405_37750 [Rufibacter glacialis]
MEMKVLPAYVRTLLVIYGKRLLNAVPLFRGKKYVAFALLGRARTGSTLLHTYLNNHTRVLSLDEFLHPSRTQHLGPEQLLDYLHTTGLKPYSPVIKAVGFKLFYGWQQESFQKPIWEVFQQDASLKVIHLKRRNHLRSLVSLKIAQKNQKWSKPLLDVPEAASAKAIFLTPQECLRHFTVMEEEEAVFDAFFAKQAKLEVFYEELVQRPQEVLHRVQDFLGVKRERLETLLARQNPEPLAELIQNFAELKAYFQETNYHSFFLEEEA